MSDFFEQIEDKHVSEIIEIAVNGSIEWLNDCLFLTTKSEQGCDESVQYTEIRFTSDRFVEDGVQLVNSVIGLHELRRAVYSCQEESPVTYASLGRHPFEIDEQVADVLLQIAAFGEVVYD
jgi:hypothetical protein